ncbi:hypothetical protein LX69_02412 [Breznakibacter xylanolyticus]|uniref:Uncharacterized protein n=1 Tax=Breznakibacter xylanolyticus TaxID=990 RepID=A0A2W7PXX2_9BACT|nr:hypothetical protein LX69_02412 [Breznakibacter xylanolyticus]
MIRSHLWINGDNQITIPLSKFNFKLLLISHFQRSYQLMRTYSLQIKITNHLELFNQPCKNTGLLILKDRISTLLHKHSFFQDEHSHLIYETQ